MPPSGRHEKNEGLFKFELVACAERDITGFWNLSYLWVDLNSANPIVKINPSKGEQA